MAPREVTFHEIELLSFASPANISLRIRCSAGAYVRSLAYELGQALGTAGHLSHLRRLEAGPFSVADASGLPAIERTAGDGGLAGLLLTPDAGLGLPRLTLSETEQTRLGYGQKIYLSSTVLAQDAPLPSAGSTDGWRPDELAAAYDRRGRFLGIARSQAAGGNGDGVLWKAEKWLAQQLGRLS